MNSFLLIDLTAGLLSPIATKAESYWLIINRLGVGGGIEKIETKSMEQCLEQGEIQWKKSLEASRLTSSV